MQRLSGIVLAGAFLLLAPTVGGGDVFAQDFPTDSDIAIMTFAIKANSTGDYEQILDRLREALVNSDDPVRNQMARGWRVFRQANPLPNGDVVYTHLISPVPGGNYSIMQNLYDEFPEEQQTLYAMYQDAFSQNFGVVGADLVVDLSQ